MSNFWLALDELQTKLEEKCDGLCNENGGTLMSDERRGRANKTQHCRIPPMKNVNARFLNEAKEIEARWAQSGLLEGLDNRYSRATTALLLESQRLVNEVPTKDFLKQRYDDAVRELYEDEEDDEVTLFLKESKRRAEARKYRCPTTG